MLFEPCSNLQKTTQSEKNNNNKKETKKKKITEGKVIIFRYQFLIRASSCTYIAIAYKMDSLVSVCAIDPASTCIAQSLLA